MKSIENPAEIQGRPQHETAVFYIRVSTPSQVNKAIDPEGYSIPAHRDAIDRKRGQLNDAEKIGEYIEPGRTATNMNPAGVSAAAGRFAEAQADLCDRLRPLPNRPG